MADETAFQSDAFQSDAFQAERVTNFDRDVFDPEIFDTDAAAVPNFDGSTFDSAIFDTDTSVAGAGIEVSYALYEPVGSSLAFDYLLGADDLGVDLEISYGIRDSIGADLVANYWLHVGVLVYQDQSTDYLIYSFAAASDLTFDYEITMEAGEEFTVDYALDPKAWADLKVDYRLLTTSVGKEIAADYRLLGGAGASLDVDYGIYGSLLAGVSLQARYAIDAIRNVVIRYDDVDITEHLLYRECEFISQTNGSVGTASILVMDAAFTHEFVTGRRLELYISSELMWSGYVASISYEYPFSYEDLQTNVQALPRYLRLRAQDINILFERRVTMKKSEPTQLEGPTFKEDYTPDTEAIDLLCRNWLSLENDDLDVVSMVENVGAINVDQPANPWQAGETWKDAMTSIASLPAAVFYLSPDRKLVYTDVDTVTNPLVLSDQPDDPELNGYGVGYRDARWTSFGDRLTNDYLAWGVSQAPPVFKRLQDQPSINLHNRWQDAVVNQSIYKQATINKVANRMVYGSPGSRRGHKDDRESLSCTTYQPGFNVAQKVRVISNVFDFDDVLPIRQMRITFPTPTDARYDLTLSHEIDTFGFFDVIRFKKYKYPKISWKPPVLPPGPPEPACIVLDSFSRATDMYTYNRDVAAEGEPQYTAGEWGAGEQLTWTRESGVQLFVDGSAGVMHLREPMWPDPYRFGGGTVKLEATIPSNVRSNNIVIKFHLGRLERIIPTGSVVQQDRLVAAFGPGEWQDTGYISDYDEGNYQSFGYPFTNDHWQTFGYVDSHIYYADYGYSFTCIPMPIGGAPVRTLYRGSHDDNADAWHPNGGGFMPGISLWGNAGGEQDGQAGVSWTQPAWEGTINGLAYRDWIKVKDLLLASLDGSGYIFNQPVNVTFEIGGHSVSISKEPSAFGYTGDGLSRQLFGVDATSDNSGSGEKYTAPNLVEPDYSYFLRIWRPDSANTYTKIWQEDLEEPTNWAYSGYDSTHPPVATVSGSIYYDEEGNVIDWPNGMPSEVPIMGGKISVAAQIFTMYQYSVHVDGIWSCDETSGTDNLPFIKPDFLSGSSYSEDWDMVNPTQTIRTTIPYQAGTTTLWLNGVAQARGFHYSETDPSTGQMTLNFIPDLGDKISVTYVVK
jgi:hypothetical protein